MRIGRLRVHAAGTYETYAWKVPLVVRADTVSPQRSEFKITQMGEEPWLIWLAREMDRKLFPGT